MNRNVKPEVADLELRVFQNNKACIRTSAQVETVHWLADKRIIGFKDVGIKDFTLRETDASAA